MTTTTSAFLLKHLDVKSRSGFEWLCLCPYHKDNNPSFSINIRKKLFICYACGAKGNMNQLMSHLGVTDEFEKEEVSLSELSDRVRSVNELVTQTKRPPVGIPIPTRVYADSQAIQKYWVEERKLHKNAIDEYELGFDSLNEEAIIPVRDINGHNIGMIRRTFDPSRPRYLYSKGMKTSEVVFGAYEAMQLAKQYKNSSGVLVITEGAVDAMTVLSMNTSKSDKFYVGVAILGSRMSKEQSQIIKKMGFENIIIATDMDRAGKVAQIQVQTMLKDVKAGAFIHKANWDESLGKDLNSLTLSKMISVITTLVKPKKIASYTTTTSTWNTQVNLCVNGQWELVSMSMLNSLNREDIHEVTKFGDQHRSFIWQSANN